MPEIVPRIRMIAGPNGSGKTTLLYELQKIINIGYYLNSDDLEQEIKKKHFINLDRFGLIFTQKDLEHYLKKSTFTKKISNPLTNKNIFIKENILAIKDKTDAYLAALINDFLRDKLIQNKLSFTFETVMSHPSKVDIFRQTKKSGYRNYLYYIATESAELNVERVELRVKKGEHSVDPKKIKDRYYRSLDLLFDAIKTSNRAFIFDNSSRNMQLLAEIIDGKVIQFKSQTVPDWFYNYVLKKV